ncbi:MAG: alpha/beta fold hydrolase [Actinomycetota bacterium]|nr:alpha/beta fold hydrolase [Actinomycetota bacterium]
MHFETSQPGIDGAHKLKIATFEATHTTLAYTRYTRTGSDPGERVVLLHGFTQNASSFRNIACRLALGHGYEVIAVDLPCHRESSKVEADLEQAAEMLLVFGAQSIWVGYSLGARHLLTLCLSDPENSWRAVFSGVNPGIRDEDERRLRYNSDLALSQELRQLHGNPEGFRNFCEQWTSLPLFQPRGAASKDIETRLLNLPERLARSIEITSIGVQPNLWPLLERLNGNFVLVTGGQDAKYLQIADSINSQIGSNDRISIDLVVVEHLGHSAIFDQPESLVDAVVSLSNR